MRVIEPHQLRTTRKPNAHGLFKRSILFFTAIFIIIVCLLSIWSYNLPIPKVTAQVSSPVSNGVPVNITWPTYGQTAFGATSYGLLDSTDVQKAVPIASVAKIMTALAVLKVKPIASNQQGPDITLTESDVQLYDDYLSQNGSVVSVAVGEQISERQALETMLLPSANNMADSLANWAFGSISSYSKYANKMALELGMNNTSIDSASGFSAQTTSTASDLVKLGIKAIENPVISSIVSMRQSSVSIVGFINNTNVLLGKSGIIGIKTGHTDQSGGCYLFATKYRYGLNNDIIFVGAVLGADTLSNAMQSSLKLIKQITPNITQRTVVKKGTIIGRFNLPWGGQSTAVAAKDLKYWSWKGSELIPQIYINDLTNDTKNNSVIGNVKVKNQSVDLLLSDNDHHPSAGWRLKRWL